MADTKKKSTRKVAKTPKVRNKPLAKKGDRTQTEQRLRVVEGMISKCITHASIQSSLAKEWGVTRRTIRVYIKRVYDRMEKDAKAMAVDNTARRRAQFEGILEHAMTRKPPDLRAANIALDRLCRIDGAYAPIKAEVNDVSDSTANMTSGEKRKRMNHWLRVIAERKAAKIEEADASKFN